MKKSARPRPPLFRLSEEMKQWSAMLASEVASWPQVSVKPMFGFDAFYRSGSIFAALPRTRTMESPKAISFKLPRAAKADRERAASEARILASDPEPLWFGFEISSAVDIRDALTWLDRAYRAAQAPTKRAKAR